MAKERIKKSLVWVIEHLFFPSILILVGIAGNNYIQERNLPLVTADTLPYKVVDISEDNFRVICPFKIKNSGGSQSSDRKVTFLIPRSASIEKIAIPSQFKAYLKIWDGGIGFNYVVYSLALPSQKDIEGSISFISNLQIPEKGMCPLRIIF